MLYRLMRPIFFQMKPETAHNVVFGATKWLQSLPLDGLRSFFAGADSRLHQELFGMDFSTPLGLAAGLDKNATHVLLWQLMGFGFVEVGSVTAKSCDGNPRPRLFRLPEDQALINRMGLNNHGAERVFRNVATCRHRLRVPLGINLAKTHDPEIMGDAALEDFQESFRILAPLASYVTLNVSCPNTTEGKTFEDPASLDALLDGIQTIAEKLERPPPLLVKLSPPKSPDGSLDDVLKETLAVIQSHNIDGLIIANTASPGSVPALRTTDARLQEMGRGGLSGQPLQPGALRMLKAVFAHTEGELPLIGVGGIHDVDSAYAMIRAGASLLQMYTGLIYQGPGVIKRIHKGLIRRLDADGFGKVSEAVGVDACA